MINKIAKASILILATVILISGCAVNKNSASNPAIEKLNVRAKALLDSGDVDGAISRLESIMDLNPRYYQTHYNLAIAYYQKKKYDKSINELNTVISLNKKFADAYYTLAIVYEDKSSSLEELPKTTQEQKQLVFDGYKSALDNYSTYVKLAGNSPDKETAQQKVSELNQKLTELAGKQ